jgi:TonB family protein
MDFAPVSLSGTSDCQVKTAQSQNHNFMLRVQAAIGPKFLDGHGQEGRVLVAFSISGSGQLLGVRLAQSSGINKLDAMAMQIVGKANFPTPPTGLGVVHRTFVSAFSFG